LFARLHIPEISVTIPFSLAYGIGAVSEVFHQIFRAGQEPRMTRFLAEQLAKSHYFSCEKARIELGYMPIVSTAEGMEQLIGWVKKNEKTL
jgi:nucleoside-diphosphate-sugar epimerase